MLSGNLREELPDWQPRALSIREWSRKAYCHLLLANSCFFWSSTHSNWLNDRRPHKARAVFKCLDSGGYVEPAGCIHRLHADGCASLSTIALCNEKRDTVEKYKCGLCGSCHEKEIVHWPWCANCITIVLNNKRIKPRHNNSTTNKQKL